MEEEINLTERKMAEIKHNLIANFDSEDKKECFRGQSYIQKKCL